MASAKKKQDEKNLKTLRELVSQPGNKECFDCQQRGPTYVNMTIGSFVCTTCSGMLRGLTPPHRVKSISMATFNQEEIDFLRERGNEFCRAIWLGLMPQSTTHSSRDEQKMKDFMSAKYELKRYYLDPAMASQLLGTTQKHQQQQNGTYNKQHQQPQAGKSNSTSVHTIGASNSSSSSNTIAPLVKAPPSKSISTYSVSNRISGIYGKPPSSSSSSSKELPVSPELVAVSSSSSSSNTADFVADFSKVPAPAPSPLTIPTTKYPPPPPIVVPQPSFANFEDNPIFDSSKANQTNNALTPVSTNLALTNTNANTNGTAIITNNTPPPPPEDRYAALKDLDSMMKQASLKDETLSSKPTWNLKDINNAANNSNTWAAFDQTNSPFISNPFTNQSWWPSVNILNNNLNGTTNNNNNNNNNNFQPFENNVSNSANPFRQTQVPVFNNDSCWFGRDTQNVENISSSHLSPISNKSWQPAVTGFRANPFAVGSGIENTTRNSNNPFL